MQAVFRLILEGLAMFVGSWAAGCVPIYVRMDQSKFNILALFGAGLLIGAALAVILPEGVETLSHALLSQSPKNQMDDDMIDSINNNIGWSLVAGFCVMFLIDNLFPSAHAHEDAAEGCGVDGRDNDSAACLGEIQMGPTTGGARVGASEFTLHDPQRHQHHQNLGALNNSASSLVISPQNSANSPYSVTPTSEDGNWDEPQKPKPKWRQILGQIGCALSPRSLPSTLIGILVHSCADGLALGAAVAASASAASTSADKSAGEHSSSMELIVFMALLLHKAPAAFGLITTLKQQGFATYKLNIWLTVFAVSAPLAALATFSVFLMIGGKSSDGHAESDGIKPWAGTVMLFSAGTFMYVAMAHTLAEAVHQAKVLRGRAASNGSKLVLGSLSLLDIIVLLAGVILPPLVSKDHDG
ncbi:Zinc/iron permease [Kickxella alabastrina]|uniref:Zinc/iron permease n=1 Tax=Kickxella alabastrina TaxID=61397 RepID=UPI00221EE980|nr:Zinc/iron permease [Kickxella alabastrina]KAI7823736.1 Zinc/iron permease [Kickxella alabastrina]KAJ1945648.1 hypothetical protein GGF37_001589 [Kickxella alabastrina]